MRGRIASLARMAGLVLAGTVIAGLMFQPASTAPPAARAWGAGSATFINDFDSATFTNLLSRTVNPPASGGALVITGTVSLEEDCSLPGIAHLDVRLRVDNHNIWAGESFEASPNVACPGPATEGPWATATATVHAVVPVSSAPQTVQLQGREDGGGSFITGRSLSILWVEAGTGPVPFPNDDPVTRQTQRGQ
jgi:hypothetical protein